MQPLDKPVGASTQLKLLVETRKLCGPHPSVVGALTTMVPLPTAMATAERSSCSPQEEPPISLPRQRSVHVTPSGEVTIAGSSDSVLPNPTKTSFAKTSRQTLKPRISTVSVQVVPSADA